MPEYLIINNEYRIKLLKSYRVETSMEIPADAFEFIVGNQNYEVSKLIAAGDELKFYIDDKLALEGIIDDLDLEYSKDSNDIRITGRDKVALLLDNDATPKTYNKMGLNDYLAISAGKYGIKYKCDDNTKFDKIVVTPGETEYAVIERLAKERNLIVVYADGVLQVTKYVYSWTGDYLFSNNNGNYAIKIINFTLSISADVRSKVIVYGEEYKKNKNIKGEYDGKLGINKVKIINEYDIENKKDADARAKQEFFEVNKNALTAEMVIKTTQPIGINKAARIEIKRMGLNVLLMIEGVTYTKDIRSGTVTNLKFKLMPGVKAEYGKNKIPVLPRLP